MNINEIIISKGPIKNIYSSFNTEYISNENIIINLIKNNNGMIWIRNGSHTKNKITDLDIFAKYIDNINSCIILITSDGDRSVPSSYSYNTINKILNSNKIKIWYTQNYDRTILNNKLKSIPIGLDLHTRRWLINNSREEKLNYMMKCRNKFQSKKKIIFSDTHFFLSHPERKQMYNTIKNNKYIYFLKKPQSFKFITIYYNNFQFVISPRGNGLDCHRTWELFLAGCIVITKTSPLDNLFIENNLPVIIIKDWNELNENTGSKLNEWYNKYYPLTSVENIYPKIKFDYWLK